MKQKRVEFLRHFNDYPMLAIFTIDTVAITIFSFLVFFSITMIGGAPLIMIIGGSIAFSCILLYVYVKTKRSASKGLLKHWFFSKGIYRLKYDEDKWEELKHSDSPRYFPHGGDKFFAD